MHPTLEYLHRRPAHANEQVFARHEIGLPVIRTGEGSRENIITPIGHQRHQVSAGGGEHQTYSRFTLRDRAGKEPDENDSGEIRRTINTAREAMGVWNMTKHE